MSYESRSVFPQGTPVSRVRELIDLLGYRKHKKEKNWYFWYDAKDFRSHTSVELYLHWQDNGQLVVSTRTNSSRSYWDMVQQNKTIRLFRDLLGAPFETDAGKNRCWKPENQMTPIQSGCYLAMWRFNNAMITPRIYLESRTLKGQIASPNPTGFRPLDEMNPRLFSNNLLLPYLVAVWEEFFKSTFSVLLSYSPDRASALKRAKMSSDKLEHVAAGKQSVEVTLAQSFSFQRPSIVAKNFQLINPKFDLAGALRKPYRRRKRSLFDTVEHYVDIRNEFVHTGNMELTLTDSKITTAIKDFRAAVDRSYLAIGKHFGFVAVMDF